MSDVKQYRIDNEIGSTSIGEIPVGSKVYDPSWEWEFRTGYNYDEELLLSKDGNHVGGLKKQLTGLSLPEIITMTSTRMSLCLPMN